MTRILAGLERRGLVSRRPDPDDGRRALVSLSPTGVEVHDRIADRVGPERARLFAGIEPELVQQTFAVLAQIEANVLLDPD